MLPSSATGEDNITIDFENSSKQFDLGKFNEQFEIDFGEEWRTHFPDLIEVKKMCEDYPALEKALENFKTVYRMVKDDYDKKSKD